MGGAITRYIGGKRPENFFKDDMWPQVEKLFTKIGLNEEMSLQLLKIFATLDIEEDGEISAFAIMDYFGRERSTYIERMYATYIDYENTKQKFKFTDFVITIWNFATLDSRQIARFLFELMDPDVKCVLEKPDIETMYRLMYECDEYDPFYVDVMPFDREEKINKKIFMEYLRRKVHLIEPGLAYQKIVIRKCCGEKFWEKVRVHRKKYFHTYEEEAATLEEALRLILSAEPLVKEEIKVDADDELQSQMTSLQQKLEEDKKEFIERQNRKAELKRLADIIAPEDLLVDEKWSILDSQCRKFEGMKFTLSEPLKRTQEREKLYELFDDAVKTELSRLADLEMSELAYKEGTEDDRNARLSDYVKTETGGLEFERQTRMEIVRAVHDNMILHPQEGKAYCDRLKMVARVLDKMQNQGQRQQRQAKDIAKGATKNDIAMAEKRAYENMMHKLMEDLLTNVRMKHAQTRDAAILRHKKREYNLAVYYGSRTTKWELVVDVANGKESRIFVNTETLVSWPEMTAICENCDNILEKSDVRCFICQTARNERNAKYLVKPKVSK